MLTETVNNGAAFLYPNISVCAGIFRGYVGGPEAGGICANFWHVCSTNDIAVIRSVPYADQNNATTSANKCFAFNAAQDWGLCRFCTGNIHEDDMAGFGNGCLHSDEPGCYTEVAGDKLGWCCSGYLTTRGCEGNDYVIAGEINGVVCCADNAQDPCFFWKLFKWLLW